jgi:hypothetical protein
MTNHLSSEQISRCIAGDIAPQERQHLHDCLECETELARVQALLSDFRSAVSQWAEAQQPDRPHARFARQTQWRVLRWAPAVAAAAVVTVIPLYKSFQERERQAEAAQAAQAEQDAVLLERIDLQLSRTAPESLQPLMDLISDTKTDAHEGDRR